MSRFLAPFAALALASTAGAAVIRVDFGGTANQTTESGVTWNNLTGYAAGSNIANLRDTGDGLTGIRLEITGAFRGVNSGGTTTSTLFPSDASRDSFFGNTVSTGSFPGTYLGSQLTLSGLNPAETYSILFYASRTGDSVNRETSYIVADGNGSQTRTLNANNTNGSVAASGLIPDSNGRITINVTSGANNATTEKFFYLGVMEITSVPEPSVALLGAGAAAFLLVRRRHG
ncbi:hypothetical protein OVA24_00840 [Luteolibacter sp. SL250]|uniref:hypothetical protein n=1 Tax=Luteolibacter sp. SL250 TaxID=2995170 RepID=UPI0022718703|nr:hypothetical protein [Luteolibacter sp. SL250]WAC19923.1 hypothetical protein OVA24_00840 [Luteolibacter sp. SL250]